MSADQAIEAHAQALLQLMVERGCDAYLAEFLRRTTGLSESTLRLAITELESRGAVRVVEQPRGLGFAVRPTAYGRRLFHFSNPSRETALRK